MEFSYFLSKYKKYIQWIHIGLVLGLVFVPSWIFLNKTTPLRLLSVFFLGLLAFCQNIGVIHELDHRLPAGPRPLGEGIARLLHALGGLRYQTTRVTHGFHHLYLGTSQDPDRNGYNQTTLGVWRKLRYLFFIGPIRSKFAPVDISPFIAKLSLEKKKTYFKGCKQDAGILVATHLLLIVFFRVYYVALFASLLLANMLSNIREMTEHGNHGNAAYVNIQPSILGMLFFSTPGFWYHGAHHMNPEIHYLDLPLKHKTISIKPDLPFLKRKSYLKFLFSND